MSKQSNIPQLRFKGFDGEWKNFKFPEIIIKSNQGVNTTTEKVEYSNEGYTVIRSNNISENDISFKDVKYVDEETFKKIKSPCKPKKGDILYCNIGSALGSAALYLLNEDIIINWNVFRIQPNLSIIDNFFMTQELNRIRKTMRRYATESTMPFISSKAFNFIQFKIPTLPEQEKIASFLSAVDEKIQQLTRKAALLEQYKKGVMQQLFSGKLRFKDENGEEYADWEEKRLDTIISKFIVPMRDKPKELNGKIPWCRIEDFDGKYLSKSKSGQGVSIETVKEMNLKVYPTGTLLVSCSANLGFCAITEVELITNQTFIGLVPNDKKVDVLYLLYVMRMLSHKLNTLSSGTTISYLSRQQFEQFKVPYPNLKEQQKIAGFLSGIDEKIGVVQGELLKMQGFKKGLLQRMFV